MLEIRSNTSPYNGAKKVTRKPPAINAGEMSPADWTACKA